MIPYRTASPIDIYIEPMPARRRPVLTQLRVLALVACAVPFAPATVACFGAPAQMAAATGYEAQQMRCVEQYATKVDIDRCRAKVRAAWMVDAGQAVYDPPPPRTLNIDFDNDGGAR